MTPLSLNDKVTIPTGYKIKHTYVCVVRCSDASIEFRVEWHNKYRATSVRTLFYSDEGRRWARGHLDPKSDDARALCAAQVLIGESPWNEQKQKWWSARQARRDEETKRSW